MLGAFGLVAYGGFAAGPFSNLGRRSSPLLFPMNERPASPAVRPKADRQLSTPGRVIEPLARLDRVEPCLAEGSVHAAIEAAVRLAELPVGCVDQT
jgi:hypothetical protein